MHLGGNVGPEPQLAEVIVAQGVHSEETDHRKRFNAVARAKTRDMRADAGNIDHEGFPETRFYLMNWFLHDRGNRAREMKLRGDMTCVKMEVMR